MTNDQIGSPTAKIFRLILPVSDIDAGADFYQTLLQSPGQRVSPGRHYFACGGVIVALYDHVADGDDDRPIRSSEPVYLSMADLKTVLDRAIEGGASPVEQLLHGSPMGEVGRRPWGEVSVYIADPFGNHLCLVEAGTEFLG